jgi:hypothetical protein
MKMNKLAICALVTTLFGLVSTSIFARAISMYDQPTDKAKVIGSVDLAAGIIPIYTPKDSNWIKIADPKNGNTGWVKSSDLSSNGSSSFSFSTRFISGDGSKKPGYQIIQIGGENSNKDFQTEMVKLQQQQAAIQQSVNKSINNMVDDMNRLYKQYQQMMNSTGMPVVMPVMLVPVTPDNKAATKSK